MSKAANVLKLPGAKINAGWLAMPSCGATQRQPQRYMAANESHVSAPTEPGTAAWRCSRACYGCREHVAARASLRGWGRSQIRFGRRGNNLLKPALANERCRKGLAQVAWLPATRKMAKVTKPTPPRQQAPGEEEEAEPWWMARLPGTDLGLKRKQDDIAVKNPVA
jgi:hypothetical protein